MPLINYTSMDGLQKKFEEKLAINLQDKPNGDKILFYCKNLC